MKSLTVGQMCALIAIGIISNKLLLLPSILYGEAGQDAIFAVAIKFAIAVIIICLLMWVLMKNPDKNLRELISSVIGDVGYRILAILIFILYLFKNFSLFMESELFLGSTMYDEYSKLLFFLPTIFVAGYIAYKGLQTLGRTCEALFGVIFVGLFITFLFSIANLDISNILPLGTRPFGDIINALNTSFTWFGNYFVILFCLGDVKVTKHLFRKVMITSSLAIFLVVMFFVIYYASFEFTAGLHKFAISDITQFSPQIASFTKVDWFTVIIWMITIVLQCAVQVYIMQRVFVEATGIKKTQIFSYVFLAVFSLLYILNPFNNSKYVDFVCTYLSPYDFIIGIFIIGLTVVASIRFSKKGGGKNDKTTNEK